MPWFRVFVEKKVPQALWELLLQRAEQMGCDMSKLIDADEPNAAKVIPIKLGGLELASPPAVDGTAWRDRACLTLQRVKPASNPASAIAKKNDEDTRSTPKNPGIASRDS